MKVSRAELQIVEGNFRTYAEASEKKHAEAFQQLWDNQRELKQGLDVAEFHLRAYRRLIADLCNKVFGDGDVEMVEVPVGTVDEGGEPIKKRVVNMRHYFELAKLEIQEMIEKEKRETADAAVRLAVLGLYNACAALPEMHESVESLADLAERVSRGEKILKDESGKELVLDARTAALAVQLFSQAIKLKTMPPAPEAAAALPGIVAADDGIPEGAAVFGGEHATSDPGNTGQEEESDTGGEDGPSSSVQEGEVPTVQAGDGSGGPEQGQRADV